MIRVLALFFLVFCDVSLIANAEVRWDSLYDGDSQTLYSDLQFGVLDRPKLPFEEWVRGYSNCQPEAASMIEALREYNQAFRFGQQKQAETIYSSIKEIIESRPSCHKTLWSMYFVKSYMLGPHPHIPYKYDTEYFKPEAAFLATLLANEGKILPLTYEKRLDLSEGNENSLWLKKNENDQFQITAFYDCSKSQIYIGADLKPFNAGSSLIHEIEHLYRDKFAEEWGPVPSNYDEMKAFLVADELMATIHGGYHQVHTLKADQYSGQIPLSKDYGHYGGEFNFYAVAGPLYQTIDYLPVFITPVSFKSFQNWVSAFVHEKKDPTMRGYICEMGTAITEGYFGPTNEECDVEQFFPERLFLSESYFQFLRQIRQLQDESTFINELAKWKVWTQSPSKVCQSLIQYQEDGHFKEYIGTSLMNGGHGGNEGIRPCLRVHF